MLVLLIFVAITACLATRCVAGQPLATDTQATTHDVLHGLSPAERRDIIGRQGHLDLTDHLNRALATHLNVAFPAGTFTISSALVLRSGQRVFLSAGTILIQRTRGQPAFAVTGADNVRISLRGGTIRGPGGWSPNWTGSQGQEGYRGISLTGCTGCVVEGPGLLESWGNAAIAAVGGRNIRISNLSIRGTAAEEEIPPNGNNQSGIYVGADPSRFARFGTASDVVIDRVRIADVAQGVLREAFRALIPLGPTTITALEVASGAGRAADAPGQHGIYNQDSQLIVRNSTFRSLHGSALKIQSGDARRVLSDVIATGIDAANIGGAVFELGTIYPEDGGGLSTISLDGQGQDVGYGLTVNGRARGMSAKLDLKRIAANAIYLFGTGIQDAFVQVRAEDVHQEPVVVTASMSRVTFDATFGGRINAAGLKDGAAVRLTHASGEGRQLGTALLFSRLEITPEGTGLRTGLMNNTCDSPILVNVSPQDNSPWLRSTSGPGKHLIRQAPQATVDWDSNLIGPGMRGACR